MYDDKSLYDPPHYFIVNFKGTVPAVICAYKQTTTYCKFTNTIFYVYQFLVPFILNDFKNKINPSPHCVILNCFPLAMRLMCFTRFLERWNIVTLS